MDDTYCDAPIPAVDYLCLPPACCSGVQGGIQLLHFPQQLPQTGFRSGPNYRGFLGSSNVQKMHFANTNLCKKCTGSAKTARCGRQELSD